MVAGSVPKKALPQPGKKAMVTLDVMSPTVDGCLSELTSEVQDLLKWAEDCGSEAAVWGLDATLFMAVALRLRNPARVERAIQAADALAATECVPQPSSAAMVSALVDSAIRDVTGRSAAASPEPPPVELNVTELSEAEALAVADHLLAGGVLACGCQLPLLRVEGSDLIAVKPVAPAVLVPELARNAELAHARARIAAAHPRVLGTGLEPPPPPLVASATTRVPLVGGEGPAARLAAWLVGGGWAEYFGADAMANWAPPSIAALAGFPELLRVAFLARR